MNPIKQMKAELKALATQISSTRKAVKAAMRAGSKWDLEHPNWIEHGTPEWKMRWNQHNYGSDQYRLMRDSQHFRVLHVAYCMLRGTPYELIEPKVRDGNEIDMGCVQKIIKKVGHELEALRARAE